MRPFFPVGPRFFFFFFYCTPQLPMPQSTVLGAHPLLSSSGAHTELPLTCSHCGICMTSQESLKEHFLAKHCFPCHHPDCHSVFPSIGDFNKHEEDRHCVQVE